MSKDTMSKIRAGDVWKHLERVLADFRIPKGDWRVEDVRPHPRLTVTFCGKTRAMHFSGTPSSRRTPKNEEMSLRKMLREMQAEAMAGAPAPQPRPVVKAITFRGAEIDTVMHDGEPHVAMKPIVDGMGLDWSGQLQRAKADAVLGPCVGVIPMQVGGQSRDVAILPLKMLNGFLFGIDDKRVRAELRDGVIAYKRECYDALARYWLHGAAVRPVEPAQAAAMAGLTRDALHDLGGVVKSVTGKAIADLRADIYAALEGLASQVRACQPAPAADAVVVRDFVSSLTIIADMAMVPAESRYPGLSQWVSRRMTEFSASRGVEVKRVPRYPGEKCVFGRAVAEEWLRTTGMREIWAAIDRRNGPGTLFEGDVG